MGDLGLKDKLLGLIEKGITFDISENQLIVKGNLNALGEQWKIFLKSNKQEIVNLIKQQQSIVIPSVEKRNTSLQTPLSYSQQRLWLLDKIDGGSAHYNMPGALKLSGSLDHNALNQAFSTILERHESLRTCFAANEAGEPYQVITPASAFSIAAHDLSKLEGCVRELAAELINDEAGRAFDLSHDLMLRGQLLKVAEDEHILLVTMHHIASDGWSMSILINEFSTLYRAYSQDQANPLPPLAIQYADYAYWQRSWLQGDVLDEQLGYWEQQLADLPVAHSLPLDRPRPQLQSFAGSTHYSQVAKTTSQVLTALCQAQGATVFMGLHAAFSALLSRYSNETDIVVGSPIANREQAEIAGLIGFFVNTLVLRSDLSENPSFAELLAQSKTMLLDAYAHQQVPFEQIVERLQPERSISHSPLFQVMLVLQNNEVGTLELPDLTLSPVAQSGVEVAKHDLTLNVSESAEGLFLHWEYNTDLFDVSTIARMADHFNILLASMVTAPQASVFTAEMLSDTDRQQLLVDWNETAADYPAETCIHELFEAQAASKPDAIALLFDGQQLTYGELNTRANQLAHYLVAERQVQPDTLVGICLERSLEMVIAILGVLKAGGAYVPLDPDYPAARLAYMLDDAALTTVITQSRLLDHTPVSPAQALCLDDEHNQAQLDQQPSINLSSQQLGLTASHLAYVIYTSGSTGQPKGVMVEHHALVNRIDWMDSQYGSLPTDRILQKTPFSFDVSVWEFVWPLTVGAGLVLAKPEGHKDPVYLSELIRTEQITKLHFVPSMLGSMLSLGDLSACPSLQQVFCSGEALSLHHVEAFKECCPAVELHNLYGPTEAAIDVSYWDCGQPNDGSSVPIGRPIQNIQLQVFNAQLELVPQGSAGELHIGGVGLARGYLNRSDLSAEKFIANPLYDKTDPNSSERLYKTGDLVRWLPDGNLEFLGRIDHQVKIRGFRIELGEIENSLSAHDTVNDAVVLAKESVGGDTRLVAYVVTDTAVTDNDTAVTELLRRHLSEHLPDYMVPGAFVLLEQFPLTPNGKIDRKALPDPDLSQQQGDYIAPRTETEQVLCDTWQEVLGAEQVGVTDNFFQLGGHSLLVMQVISRLQHAGIAITARELFATPTPAGLALSIEGAIDKGPVFNVPANLIPDDCTHITPEMLPLVALSAGEVEHIVARVPGGAGNVQDIYPLGPLQEGILFHHMMSTRGDPYVLPSLFRIKGEQAVSELLASLQFVVDRHDVLRTAVLWDELSVPVQVVYRDVDLPVSWIELEQGQDALSYMQGLCAPESQQMDLRQGPLLKLQIARIPNTEQHLVLLQFHHIISDHIGLEVIQRELALYQAGKGDSLSVPVPYREFVAHAQHQAEHSDAETYFRNTLGDIDEPTAPFNLVDVQGDGSQIVEANEVVPPHVCSQLRQIAREMKISPAALFHVAWAMVVANCSGRDDVVFGTVVSGRLQGTVGAEEMLGVFINTLPLRVTLNGHSVAELVQQVQHSLQELLPYEQASLSLAQRCTRLEKGAPLFSAMLNYRHSAVVEDTAVESDSDANFEYISGQERTNYPFNLSVDDLGTGFGLNVQVDASVSAKRVASYIQTAVAGLASALADAPEQQATSLSVLPDAERHQLLVDWNSSAADYPAETCIHELFETQAASDPDATALVFDGQQLTYGELNTRANQLAHYLVTERQVQPDTLVGICIDRSLEMVVAILGVLKAGGAYVPLDPDYPAARLAYMLGDAALTTVITQSHLLVSTPITPAQAVCLDAAQIQARLDQQASTNISPQQLGLTASHLAYVIYTSGSTGKPKGVMIQHSNTTAFLSWASSVFTQEQMRCVLASTSVCFDLSVFELLAPLSTGGSVLVVKNILELQHRQYSQKISLINTVPSAARALLSGGCIPESVKVVNLAGEPLKQNIVESLYEAGVEFVYDLYGPSEDTTYTTFFLRTVGGISCIGKPIHNTQVYLLNEQLHPVPRGTVGELFIGGAGLARGYLNRPDLTAEKFIANPFYDKADPNSSERLYKTGDLVRWLPDGNLAFLGRIDHQVKIRGFRIELGEVENSLSAHDSVKDAVVIAKGAEEGDNRLVAYVVTDAVADDDDLAVTEQLRQHLSEHLPDYMVPSAFVLLKQLPLTPNGKVDRKALPDPGLSQQQGDYVAPRTETEQVLCDIWQEVLGAEQVGVTDNFFQLGGHSLLVMQVISRLHHTGIAITAPQLFATPTPAGLALSIECSVEEGPIFNVPANLIPDDCTHITREMLPLVDLSANDIEHIIAQVPGGAGNVQDIYPLGPLQEGILFHHMMSTRGDPYVLPSLFRIKGEQAVSELLASLQFVVDRHDVLRTAVLWDELPVPVQVVYRDADLPVSWVELDQGQDALSHMQGLCAPEFQQMDLRQGPLLKLQIARIPNTEQHLVLLQFHHIISDHVGLEIIQRELALYQAGKGDTLSAPVPYREFVAHAQHQAEHSDAETYFRNTLGDIDEPTAPFNLVDVQGDGSQIVEVNEMVPPHVCSQLRLVAREMKISPAALFHVAWAMVVANCSGRDDVVFGTVVSGRLQGTVGVEEMLGVFINTLPLRVTLSGHSVAELVQQVQHSLQELLPYEQASLSLAQRCTQLEKGAPLFSAMLNYRHSAVAEDTALELDSDTDANFEYIGGQERTNYPFNLSVDDLGSGFGLNVQVDASVSAERVASYMQTAVANLAVALTDKPEQQASSLSILPDAERHQLLVDWNATAADYPADSCIHELFETQAESNPEATALVFDGQQLTYGELNTRANQLAHYLVTEKQVQPDTLVGICIERSLDMVVAILGVLKAGGAYVPLDPDYPAVRLAYMLDDAQLATVITQSHLQDSTPVTPAQAVCLDEADIMEQLVLQPATNLSLKQLGLTASHLAYVIYTSGSTGKPKGVMVEHKALNNLAINIEGYKVCHPGGGWGWLSSYSFDASLKGLSQLALGYRLEIITEQQKRDPLLLSEILTDVDVIDCTPMMVELWFSSGLEAQLPNLIIGGDAINPQLWSLLCEWQSKYNKKAVNVYGPTECSVNASWSLISGESAHIGKQLSNVQFFLLNEFNDLAAKGISSELHIGGVSLARGYLNRPDLTAEKFIANPFYDKTDPNSSERLYKTGDLVRWLPDGNLEFLGRIDHQVKIRGFRIELGEIESTLRSNDDVKDAVVLAKESAGGDNRLVAYVVTDAVSHHDDETAATDRQFVTERLRQHLSERLPDYMVPSIFVLLEQLPLTPNGKVDRKALPDPDLSLLQEDYVAPVTETEKILCDIWQAVLGVEQVGITDNFFQLGGHSLLVIQVISRLQQVGIAMAARQLFVTPTPIDLAQSIDGVVEGLPPVFKAPANLIPDDCTHVVPEMLPLVTLTVDEIEHIVAQVPGGAGNVQDIYPLGPLQEGILFHHIMSPQGDPYVLPALFRIKGDQAVSEFLMSLQFVVDRHDVLRTAVLWDGLSVPVQVVYRNVDLPISWIELEQGLDALSYMQGLCAPEIQQMDLRQGPLLKLQIARIPNTEQHLVLLQFHHIISDHIGLEVIQRELALYQAGKGDSLSAPVPYREFVAHAQHQAEHNDAETYFRNALGDIDETTAPFNLVDVQGDGSQIVEVNEVVPSLISRELRQIARAMKISPAILFHAAWAMVVANCSGRGDVVFGTVVSGRLQGTVGAEEMLGVFINTLPLRVTLNSQSVAELVQQVQHSLQELLPYEQTSLSLAQRCTHLEKGAPLFSALLNYRHLAASEVDAIDLDNESDANFEYIGGQERSNYPLSLSVDDLGTEFRLNVQVDASVSAGRVVSYMQTAVAGLVTALVGAPEQPASSLTVLPEAERHQLLVDWNNTAADYPAERCIHELFEAQVETNPGATALVFDGQQLTYSELNRKANQLAFYLVAEKQVKPDTLVGICLERSLEMVIAILGVLKAGGAYVPLDPDYPAARLAYMLDDAALTTVITQSHLLDSTPVTPTQALCLDVAEIAKQLAKQPSTNLSPQQLGLTASHLAYVIYTSGSTGKPKGVMVEHQALTCSTTARIFFYEKELKAFLLLSSIGFDSSVAGMFWALVSGASLIVAPKEASSNLPKLLQSIANNNVNYLLCVPSLYREIVSCMVQDGNVTGLEGVILAGEVLQLSLVESHYESQNAPLLFNEYGPTEATVWSSCYKVPPQMKHKAVPIGKSPSLGQLLVLNKELSLVPGGTAGELHIGGAGLSRGYLNRPDLTAEKFIANPFYDKTNPNSSERLYKTGDLVRWLPDGNLEFVGRIDQQVKIRGFRIELGEIENSLSSHDIVKDVVVLAKGSVDGDMRLVAYVVTDAVDHNIDETAVTERQLVSEQLRQYLSQHLPDHMVPGAFVLLEQLPLTPNGKVDRKALPEPDLSQQQVEYVAPRTETEKVLCEIWQEVLGVEQIGLTDNFFQLGGHSLLATRVVSRIHQTLNVTLPLKTVFNEQSLEKVAKALVMLDSGLERPALVSVSREGTLLPSYGQQRLWLLDKIDGGSAHYNMPGALKLSGKLDHNALNLAFSTILERHESLRTCFATDDAGEPYQVIRAASDFFVAVQDLSMLEDDERELTIAEMVREEATLEFDLSSDLMLRGRLLKVAEDEYILLVTMHHIASDGWSMSILINEFSTLYRAYSQGLVNPLSPLGIQYADYAHWQRSWLQGDVLDEQLGFWDQQLVDLPVAHSLPLDRPRPQLQSFAGSNHYSHIDKTTSQALSTLCQAQGATLFMGLHAAFSALLARYSNETDIVMGSPIANREQAEIADLIGFFVNTLVLRSDLSENPSFTELLAQSKTMLLDAYAHQQVPFEQIVERLQPERSLNHSPLFQVMLILQNNEAGILELPGLTLSPVAQSGVDVAKYDLTFNVSEGPDGLFLNWVYNTDLFDASTIARMAEHFNVLLASMVTTPQECVFTAEMLSRAERHQLLVDWNNTAADYPAETCIHELFEAQAESNPEATALVFDGQQLTYGELNCKANQLAHYLVTEKQVLPDTLVGICTERSLEMVVAILGVLKAGGAYVPLDPEYPEACLAYMLDDAQLTTVITLSHLLYSTPITPAQAVCLDDVQIQAQLDLLPSTNLSPQQLGLTASHLAYVIYTSGSTGQPKGVMVEQSNVVNFLSGMRSNPGIQRDDCLLAVTSTSFDIHGLELFLPLITGAKIVVASKTATTTPNDLIQLIINQSVTLMQATPATWKMLLDANWQPTSSMKVLCGGEALSQSLASALLAHPSIELWNLYGPTETTIWSCAKQIQRDDERILMGLPIANTSISVVTKEMSLVPVGVPGELLIGGAGLARGYLNRPDLTAEKFIVNPFDDKTAPDSSERLYKTGDLVRWLPDGNLEFLGRIDHQVKIRGFRIELGEIENSLSTHDSVKDTVVLAKASADGDRQLVAYVVTDAAENQDDIEQLRQHVSDRLPDYMVPTVFVLLEQLPLTPNGKVDRKALPEPDLSQQQAEYVAPRTVTEKALCGIWQEVLGIDRVGVTDNFFQLGGHSLLATRVVSRIHQELNVDLPLKTLFNTHSLDQLAQALLMLDSGLDRPALVSVGREGTLLPSYGQQRLWLLDQIDGNTHYNMPSALKLSGMLDYNALDQAFSTILERHESLRTCFAADEAGEPYQVIRPASAFSIGVQDLSILGAGEREVAITDQVREEAARVFDLSNDSMLRGQLLKVAEDEHILLVTMHHIASDGWSMSILINELSTLYRAYSQGLANPLPQLAIQYADYAHWQRSWLQGEVLDEQLGYWEQQLAALPVVHSLPLDRSRPRLQSFAGSTHYSQIDKTTSQALSILCQAQGATVFMGLHAAFSALLSRYSNETDIVVGSPIANREQAEIADLIGFFVNTLVLRSDLSANPSFAELLDQSKIMLLDAYAHQQVPFEQIVERLQPARSLNHSPLFQVMLILQNNEAGTLELPGLTLSPAGQTEAIAKYDLTLNVSEGSGRLFLNWEYNTDLFDAGTIARMAEHFNILLASMVTAPQESVFTAEMLSEAERHQLLVDWNDTAADYPAEACIHELFEAQAASNPDATALVFDGQQLTYGELNHKANQMAHYLVSEKQVQPDTLVGICIERSPEMVVAMLGILKAGGAYVPLDPDYPAARLAYMLDDAQLATVITQSHLLDSTPTNPAHAVCLDDEEIQAQLDLQPSINLSSQQSGLTASHLAYVIYTSGSTGKPKGVQAPHASIHNRVSWMEQQFPALADEVFCQKTAVGFVDHVAEIFQALAYGRPLIIIRTQDTLAPEVFVNIVAQHQITRLTLVPSLLKYLIEHDVLVSMTSLRLVISSGEALQREEARSFHRMLPGAKLLNLYGSSEVGADVAGYLIDDVEGLSHIPIGRAINNSQLQVLNAQLGLVPQGTAGELHIGGAGLARGYLNRPDLTAEKFITNTFYDKTAPASCERLYKTGDLVRWLPDGNLEFLGRIDHQVKIRGFRIELGEIENSLSTHELVKDAVVLAKAFADSEKRLVAYVVIRHDDEAAATEPQQITELIRQHLSESLPDYMVPSAFVLLEQFPLTPNGKVDHTALPEPDLTQQQAEYVAPRTETEKVLCDIWQEVLGVERVGVTDNFFQLGGHSLLATRVLTQINKTFNMELPLNAIFNMQSVELIALLISDDEVLSNIEFDQNETLLTNEMEVMI